MNLQPAPIEVLPSYEAVKTFLSGTAEIQNTNPSLGVTLAKFDVELENDSFSIEVMPYDLYVQIRWVGKPFRVFDLQLHNVKSISVVMEGNESFLLIKSKDPYVEDLRLWMRPHILLFWGNNDHGGMTEAVELIT